MLVRKELADGNAVVVCMQQTAAACATRNMHRGAIGVCDEYMRDCTDEAFVFPGDVIDRCREEFGNDAIADLTGRSNQKHADVMRDFQSGKVRIALLSRAGSTGISLHAEHDDSRPRVQIMVELPWTSEAFLQQCGRVHRAQSRSKPRYVILRTDVPAEERFFTSLQHRLRAMSALTCADRQASNRRENLRNDYLGIGVACRRMVAIK